MKKFVLTTHSESGDRYMYFINAKKQPSHKQLEKFLLEHGCDKDEDQSYENVQEVVEILENKFITI